MKKLISFDGFLSFKKYRKQELYTVQLNVYCYLKVEGKGIKTQSEHFIFESCSLNALQLEANKAFNNFVDNHEFTQGVAMSGTSVKRQRYRGNMVDSCYSNWNLITKG